MGKLKLLMKSIVFSTRSKRRFFTFVIVFSILSGATIVLLSFFDNFSREGLLEHRGVVIKVSTLGNVDYGAAKSAIGTNPRGAEAVIYYRCVNFGTNLRICSINTKYKWAFSEIKPNDLLKGSFPSNDQEALVSENLLLTMADSQSGNNPSDVNIYLKPVLGTKFKLGISNVTDFELKVSGIYKNPEPPSDIAITDTREWIFISDTAFDRLVGGQNLDFSDSDIDVHSVSIIASGDVFSGASYNNVNGLAADFGNLGTEYESPIYTEKADKDEQRNMTLLSLLFGLIGTFMVSTLYSYLITRFRRREVAVLKAMGYSKWDVRIVVLTEILVVAITGFLIGLTAIQMYLWDPIAVLSNTRQSSYVYLIVSSPTALLAFLAVVLSCVPGFILITARILSVRPIEIFRQK